MLVVEIVFREVQVGVGRRDCLQRGQGWCRSVIEIVFREVQIDFVHCLRRGTGWCWSKRLSSERYWREPKSQGTGGERGEAQPNATLSPPE